MMRVCDTLIPITRIPQYYYTILSRSYFKVSAMVNRNI